jgi:hypothetical protein
MTTSYIKFNSHHDEMDIIHIFFNEVLHPDLRDEAAYAGKLKKLMQININNGCKNPFLHASEYTNDGLARMLKYSSRLNFKYAVVWYDGCWPLGEEFEEALYEDIERWNTTRWLAAGHILNRHTQDDAPVWHEQCVVINLELLKELNWPNMESWTRPNYPGYTASKENLHDDYTPIYIKGNSSETILELNTQFDDPLNILFPIAFEHDLYVHNLSHATRNGKMCIYAEDDVEFTKSWLLDTEFSKTHTLDECREFGYTRVSEDKRELYQYKVMDTHIMYITNTATVPDRQTVPVDTLVVPCSGLHQFKYASNNIDTLKRVVWTDFSPFGLAWTRKVVEEWDGHNFDAFVQQHRHIIMDMGFPDEYFIWYDSANAQEFIDSFERDGLDWITEWNKIRALKHEFIQIDVVREWERLVNTVGTCNGVFMQFSNIWQYEINYVNTARHEAQLFFLQLINEVMKRNDVVYFTGDTPNGIYHEYQDMRLLPGIM